MSSLTFPTRAASARGIVSRPGTPERAQACRCEHPWPMGDSCLRCGRYARAIIDRTWQQRALVIARTKHGRVAA